MGGWWEDRYQEAWWHKDNRMDMEIVKTCATI